MIDACIAGFNAHIPGNSVASLVNIYTALQLLPAKDEYTLYWKNKKLRETEILLTNCAGLWMEVTANNYFSGRKAGFGDHCGRPIRYDSRVAGIRERDP